MSRKLVSLFVAMLMLLSMPSVLAEDSTITVTDVRGRVITLDEPATRIVALTPADCEILCAIGCEDALVGCGAYCDYPQTIKELPVVQSGNETNIEEILALEPEVLLMTDMASLEDKVRLLEENGVKVVISDAGNLEEVYASIRMIGTLMGKENEAETLIADMLATFEEIASKSERIGKTVFFEVSPLEYGLWTAGKNSFMDEIAEVCGLTNAFADMDGWGPVSEEQVLARDPDYIVTITMYFGEGPTPVEEIMGRSGWEDVKAVNEGNVFNVNSDSISRPGPRLKDAAIELYNYLNGIEADTEQIQESSEH